MARIDVSTGITLEYDIRGEGEPLLLVGGLGDQLTSWWDDFVDLFVAAGHQVIRFDNRDAGLSSETDWTPASRPRAIASMMTRRPLKRVGYTIDDMAADGAALLEGLGIESAHVVGMSMGGMITQAMAINHPSKVRSICSIMSNTGDRRSGGIELSLVRKLGLRPDPTPENAVDESILIFSMISGDHFDEDEWRPHATALVARSFRPEGMARQAAAIAGSPDRTARLRRLAVPTLVIHGIQDPLVKPSGGIATAAAVPRSRLLMFGDMGHDIPRPRWGEISEAILTNVGRHRGYELG